jgi:tetratricopeptide (TPR) repeat protein
MSRPERSSRHRVGAVVVAPILGVLALLAGGDSAGEEVIAASKPLVIQRDAIDRANALQAVHRFAAAEAVLTAHLAAVPADAVARLHRAQIRLARRDRPGALADCLAAARGLDAVAATACVAQAEHALGASRRAREALERAILSNQAEPAVDSWASGIAAELAAFDGDLAAADRWHRRSIARAGTAHYPRLAYARFRAEHREADLAAGKSPGSSP